MQIGADVAFIEGVESADQVREVVAALAPTPVLLNLVRNSVTPNFSVQEAQALGVKIVAGLFHFFEAFSYADLHPIL